MSNLTVADQTRFESLCAPHTIHVYRLLYSLCRDHFLAEDVMQDTLLRAWKALDSLSEEEFVRPWLLTIARRELARAYKRKRIPTIDLDYAVESEGETLSARDDNDSPEIWRAILRLNATLREPIVQTMWGYSTKEIALNLQISVPAVLRRLYRARHVLRKNMLGEPADKDARERNPMENDSR